MIPKVSEALDWLSKAERARLDYDFEQGNAAFVLLPNRPGMVVGIYLERIDRLEILEAEGLWAVAKIRPKEMM